MRTTAANIVVCCDGTDNEVATDSTNVLRLFRMLERSEQQILFYDAGVGTTVDPEAISTFRKSLSRRLDAAIGMRVRENALAAYRFLVSNYRRGDRIFLFGFSRGAYTARAVAGMIRFLGLVHPQHLNLAPLAWSLYSNEAQVYAVSQRFAGGERFHQSFGIHPKPPIHFVGAWDTVSSFGWIWDFQTLPYTEHNDLIDNFRHAVSIDERRACFPQNLFDPIGPQVDRCKQAWFAGVHSDVGGGYPEKEGTLSKVSLAWMVREARACGLLVNNRMESYLMDSPDKPPADPCGPTHESLEGLWWLLECVPRRSWSTAAKRRVWRAPHFGRRRGMGVNPLLHVSVLERTKNLGYAPANLPKVYTIEH